MNTTDLYNILKSRPDLLEKYPLLRLYVHSYLAMASSPGKEQPVIALNRVLEDIIKYAEPEFLRAIDNNTDIKLDPNSPKIPDPIAAYITSISAQPSVTQSQEPTAVDKLKSLADAAVAYAQSGFKNCTKEQYEERLAICNSCEFFDRNAFMGSGKCLKCGCSGVKLKMGASKCPIDKWGPVV